MVWTVALGYTATSNQILFIALGSYLTPNSIAIVIPNQLMGGHQLHVCVCVAITTSAAILWGGGGQGGMAPHFWVNLNLVTFIRQSAGSSK